MIPLRPLRFKTPQVLVRISGLFVEQDQEGMSFITIMRTFRSLALIILFLLNYLTVPAAQTTSAITGSVLDTTGAAISQHRQYDREQRKSSFAVGESRHKSRGLCSLSSRLAQHTIEGPSLFACLGRA